jgi:hypothetical protein
VSGDLTGLLGEFTAAAAGYGAAVKVGDPKSAKQYQERVATAYRRLRDYGEAGQQSLLALLAADDLAVRHMAAVYALAFSQVEGERVLSEIMAGPPSPVRLLAQTSLSQWREGLLRL